MRSTGGCESCVRVRATNPVTPSISGREWGAILLHAALSPHRRVKGYLDRCLPAATRLVSLSLPCCFCLILNCRLVNNQPPMPAFIKHGWLISQPGRCALFLHAVLEMFSNKFLKLYCWMWGFKVLSLELGINEAVRRFRSSIWAQEDNVNWQVVLNDLDFSLLG